MNMRDLIPWGRQEASTPAAFRDDQASPFLALHREMNRMFDQVFREFGSPSLLGRLPTWPLIEVVETDKEVRVSAELPGLHEKDVEVLMSDGVLTIRGEKRSEVQDKDRQFSERYYGRFERRIPLGLEVDEDGLNASFKDGVLTVWAPKSEKAQKAKRIPINGGKETTH